MRGRSILGRVGIVIGAKDWPQSLWGGIVKVFCLFANSILTMICETTFYAPLTRSFITCKAMISSCTVVAHTLGKL